MKYLFKYKIKEVFKNKLPLGNTSISIFVILRRMLIVLENHMILV
jgi:hypothetical protein